MNGSHGIRHEAAVGEQTSERDESAVTEEAAERARNLRPSVEQEVQARIDSTDERALDGRLFGQTLVDEERMRAREWEIERTRTRWDRGQASDREARCRVAVGRVSVERRAEFGRRAASVDPWAHPDLGDPRAQLTRDELAAVNLESARLAGQLSGFSRAAISRRMANRVADGMDVPSAVLGTYEELRTAPGQVIPIEDVSRVRRREVDIEGTVTTLWPPSHPKISQVGLLEDASGRIKWTAWRKSRQPVVREGEHVRFQAVAKNWYRGRVSVALTGRSSVAFLDDGGKGRRTPSME